MTLTGVDVSRWQQTSPPFANYEFMFARATFGLKVDTMFATHIANAKKAKIITGAYHFLYGSSVGTPEAQADLFIAHALLQGADIWALDWEPSQAPATKAEAKRFIARVHASGYKIGLYASAAGFDFNLGQDFDWIAAWDSQVFPAHAEFWQYRGSPLDLDKFNGTYEELRALAARPKLKDIMRRINLADLTYGSDAVLKAGAKVLDEPGGSVIYTVKADGERFPSIGDDGNYYWIRVPGNFAACVAHGSLFGTGTADRPDDTPYSKADLTNAITADRQKARIVYS